MEDFRGLLDKSASWSLEDDKTFLEIVRKLSVDVTVNCNSVLTNIRRISTHTKLLEIKLENATNKLMLLSDTKFLESRVYEGTDENSHHQQDGLDSDQEREVETAQKLTEEQMVSEVLRNGFKMMMKKNNQVNERQQNIRALPSIIGSEEWFKDKFVQEEKTIVEEEILAADSDSLKYQEKEEKEDTVSENMVSKSSLPEKEDFRQNTKETKSAPVNQSIQFSDSEDDLEESMKISAKLGSNTNLFSLKSSGSLDSSCDSETMNSPHNVSEESIKPEENIEVNAAKDELDATDKNAFNFAAELSKKLGLPPLIKQENKPVETTAITQGLGAQDSGLLKSETKIVKSEKTAEKAKTSVLFDSDSDDDLFSIPARKQLPKVASKQKDPISVKKPLIELNDEDNSVKEDANTTEVKAKESEQHYPTKKPTLFNFSDDEDEEFFKDLKIQKKPQEDKGVSERTTPRTEIKTSLFDFDDNDDDDDDDFFQNLSLSKHASAPLSNLETTIEENEKVKNVYDDAEESKTEEKTEFTDGKHFKDEENRTDISLMDSEQDEVTEFKFPENLVPILESVTKQRVQIPRGRKPQSRTNRRNISAPLNYMDGKNIDEIYGNSFISSKEEILNDLDPTDVGLVVEKEKAFPTPQFLDMVDNLSESDLFMSKSPPPLTKMKPDSKSIFDDYSSDDSDDIFANL
ncbi:WASH complex subunit 2 isoform X2 [Eurytemora carolleeae]|uniref:WASH complex subunit 2 isoform X2 n=1 Tax=Eurytemora carolleeae TaxID=1294199 RepID=UPI000C77A9BE|nr:WASH complex subunit 2 isoform X2 [Eurytemora carolleeae]|eukprot:XP_023332062.1 WASH complex subunit 2-like isoform X2 [Eurytemora affinis]